MGARVASPSDRRHDGLPRRLEEVLVRQQRPVDVERHELRPPGRRRHATGSSSSRPFFFQAEDGIRYYKVTGVQTCALPISGARRPASMAVMLPASTTTVWLVRTES